MFCIRQILVNKNWCGAGQRCIFKERNIPSDFSGKLYSKAGASHFCSQEKRHHQQLIVERNHFAVNVFQVGWSLGMLQTRHAHHHKTTCPSHPTHSPVCLNLAFPSLLLIFLARSVRAFRAPRIVYLFLRVTLFCLLPDSQLPPTDPRPPPTPAVRLPLGRAQQWAVHDNSRVR